MSARKTNFRSFSDKKNPAASFFHLQHCFIIKMHCSVNQKFHWFFWFFLADDELQCELCYGFVFKTGRTLWWIYYQSFHSSFLRNLFSDQRRLMAVDALDSNQRSSKLFGVSWCNGSLEKAYSCHIFLLLSFFNCTLESKKKQSQMTFMCTNIYLDNKNDPDCDSKV